MILLQLLKKGQFPIHVDNNNNSYYKINYTVPEEKSIQFKITPTQNSSSLSNPIEISKLKLQLITDLTSYNLQENIHYTINSLDTITLTSAGYDQLQQQKENTANLAEALTTPDKIMALIAKTKNDDDDEIDDATEITFVKNISEKTKIIKSILDKKDEHISIEGSLGRTAPCFYVKEEYRFIHEELLKALRIALTDIAPENDTHPFEIKEATLDRQNITISISDYTEKNGNKLTSETIDSNSEAILHELINGLSSNSSNTDNDAEEQNITCLTEDDIEIISSSVLRIKPSGMSKVKKANIDFFLRRESDILSESINFPNSTQVRINSFHIKPKQNIILANSNSGKHTSLYLSNMSKTLSNSLILALKKTSYSDTRIEITANQSECVDIITISKNNHVSLLHDINKITLATEIILPILSIKNHAQKLQAFASNGDIIKAFRKYTDIYELDDLFHLLLQNQSKIDIHRNPVKDKMCFFNNTDSWNKLIHEIREYAYQQVAQKIVSLDKNQAVDLLNSCLKKAIFTTHRSNNIFNWLYSTETVKKLENLLDDVKNRKDNVPSLVRLTS